RRLTAVVLPVRVCDERGGGVEAQVPGTRVEALWVPGLDRLRAQDEVERQPGKRREDDQSPRIGLPVLLAAWIDSEQAIEHALERPESPFEDPRLTLVDARHIAAEKRHECGHEADEEGQLEPPLEHQKRSPLSSA